MIETIVRVFRDIGHLWSTKSGPIQPDESHVQLALDEAARALYNESSGARLNIGGLIVEKTESDHVVYVYVGRYK